jgi:serine/threonine protein kinase
VEKYLRTSGFLLPEMDAILGSETCKTDEEKDLILRQRLIYKNPKVESYFKSKPYRDRVSENRIVATQSKQPQCLTKRGYLELGFIKANPLLQPERIYLGLRSNKLSFERMDDYCLIMQAMFELVSIDSNGATLLQQYLLHPELVEPLLIVIQKHVRSFQKKPSQYVALYYLVSMLTGMLSFMPTKGLSGEQTRVLSTIQTELRFIRSFILGWIRHIGETDTETKGERVSYLYALVMIISFHLPLEEGIGEVILGRYVIEREFCLNRKLPGSLFLQMERYFIQNSEMIRTLCLLPSPDGSSVLTRAVNHILPDTRIGSDWVCDTTTSLLVNGDYKLDLIRGKIFVHNELVGNLPSKVYSHADYVHAFGKYFPSAMRITSHLPGTHYELITDGNKPRRLLSLFGNFSSISMVIRESSVNRDDNFWEYVSPRELFGLIPKAIIDGFTHWINPTRTGVDIRNAEGNVYYFWDFAQNQVERCNSDFLVVPFHKDDNRHPGLFECLTNFEDKEYVLCLSKRGTNRISRIELNRIHLSFDWVDNKLLSNEFQGYALSSSDQSFPLLPYSKSHLVLTMVSPVARTEEHIELTKQKKFILPNHPIKRRSRYYSSDASFDLSQIRSPSHFAYSFEKSLSTLKAESTVGQIYLAYYIFHFGVSKPDPESHLSPFSFCSQLLNCVQNEPFNDHILSIFKDWLEESDESVDTTSCRTIDAISLYLKVVYLLHESTQMLFLHPKYRSEVWEGMKAASSRLDYFRSLFDFYLSQKHVLSPLMQLGSVIEKALLKIIPNSAQMSKYRNFLANPHSYTIDLVPAQNFELWLKDALSTKLPAFQFSAAWQNHSQKNWNTSSYAFTLDPVLEQYCNHLQYLFEANRWVSLYQVARNSPKRERVILCLLTFHRNPSLLQFLVLVCRNPNSFPALPSQLINNNNVVQTTGTTSHNNLYGTIFSKCDQLKNGFEYSPHWGTQLTASSKSIPIAFEDSLDLQGQLQAIQVQNLSPFESDFEPTHFFVSEDSPSAIHFPLNENLFKGYAHQFWEEMGKSFEEYINGKTRKYSLISNNIADLIDNLFNHMRNYTNAASSLLGWIEQSLSTLPTDKNGRFFSLFRMSGIKPPPRYKISFLRSICNMSTLKMINPFLSQSQCEIILDGIFEYIRLCGNVDKVKRSLSILQVLNRDGISALEKDLLVQSLAEMLFENRNYHPKEYPSWVLYEMENNFYARKRQISLLHKMISRNNKVMDQLNMGEGKSSVILELLSLVLCKPGQVVRIVVLESLYAVTKTLLKDKFGCLLNRPIYSLPFRREIHLGLPELTKVKSLLEECERDSGILLVTPEHWLCFQLKQEETWLEFLKVKDATNIFSWVYQYNQAYQESVLQALIQTGYVSGNKGICKYPPAYSFPSFEQEIKAKMTGYCPSFIIYDAYWVLRSQSTKHRDELKQSISLLLAIGNQVFSDILDESDEILRYGIELNFTLGLRVSLPGGYWRWRVPQILIELLFTDPQIQSVLQEGQREGKVNLSNPPSIQFTGVDFYNSSLKELLAEKLLGHTDIARLMCTKEVYKKKDKVMNYIYGSYSRQNEKRFINEMTEDLSETVDVLHAIMTAKGWLHHKILYHVMSYRYRVEYGLDKRKMAVPFKAKDTPSPRSEFSHPDIAIGFTILSYYYSGLEREEVGQCLTKIKLEFNNGEEILRRWLSECEHISFSGLDLFDAEKFEEIYQSLSKKVDVIFFYLEYFIFPDGTKQYLDKITGNANSLVAGPHKRGFSGTRDTQKLMPYDVSSESHEPSTDGKMLHILSREINSEYSSQRFEKPAEFLQAVVAYTTDCLNRGKLCCVLIESGALITGFSNLDVAKYLTSNLPAHFKAVTFFNDDSGEIEVILRGGRIIPVAACHLPKQFIFTYLDDRHTRGTDLKFPLDARAIVTIGREMTKDKYMQATMRMRQLDSGQSVITWGPENITKQISSTCGVPDVETITTKHVLDWITLNTTTKIKKELPAHHMQNLHFIKKYRAMEYQKRLDKPIELLIKQFKDTTNIDLDHKYGLSPKLVELHSPDVVLEERYTQFDQELKLLAEKGELVYNEEHYREDSALVYIISHGLQDKFAEGELVAISTSDLDQDQETEQEVEVIQTVEIPLPSKKDPFLESQWDFSAFFQPNFVHQSQQGVRHFPTIKPISELLKGIKNIREPMKYLDWAKNGPLLVTSNYINTVHLKEDEGWDSYLRPVDMLGLCRDDSKSYFILFSGFEAEGIKQYYLNHFGMNTPYIIFHLADEVKDGNQLLSSTMGTTITLSPKELSNILLLKLLNGDCQYNQTEIDLLCGYLGKCSSNDFRVTDPNLNEDTCQQLFKSLVECGYLNWFGFITQKFANGIRAVGHFVIQDDLSAVLTSLHDSYTCLRNWENVIRNTFERILNNSLFSSCPHQAYLAKELVKDWLGVRDSLSEYSNSSLYHILENDVILLNEATKYTPRLSEELVDFHQRTYSKPPMVSEEELFALWGYNSRARMKEKLFSEIDNIAPLLSRAVTDIYFSSADFKEYVEALSIQPEINNVLPLLKTQHFGQKGYKKIPLSNAECYSKLFSLTSTEVSTLLMECLEDNEIGAKVWKLLKPVLKENLKVDEFWIKAISSSAISTQYKHIRAEYLQKLNWEFLTETEQSDLVPRVWLPSFAKDPLGKFSLYYHPNVLKAIWTCANYYHCNGFYPGQQGSIPEHEKKEIKMKDMVFWKTTNHQGIQQEMSFYTNTEELPVVNFLCDESQNYLVEFILEDSIDGIIYPFGKKWVDIVDLSIPELRPVLKAYIIYDIIEKKHNHGWPHVSIFKVLAFFNQCKLKVWQQRDDSILVPYTLQEYSHYYPAQPSDKVMEFVVLSDNKIAVIYCTSQHQDQEPSRIPPSGLQYLPIFENQNSLFSAVGHHIEMSVEQVKGRVIQYVNNNLLLVVALLHEPEERICQYLSSLEDPSIHCWLGELELLLLALIFDCPIVMISAECNVKIFELKEGEPIFLYFNGYRHYDTFVLHNASGGTILNGIKSTLARGEKILFYPTEEYLNQLEEEDEEPPPSPINRREELFVDDCPSDDEGDGEYIPNVPEEFNIHRSQWKRSSIIGQGGFGTVFSGTLHPDIPIAIKSVSYSQFGMANQTDCEWEAQLLYWVKSPNIISAMGVTWHRNKLNGQKMFTIVMELAQGCLSDYLNICKNQGITLSELEMNRIAKDVSMGIAACHDSGVVIQDVKDNNILYVTFHDTKIWKICDLGLGELKTKNQNRTSQIPSRITVNYSQVLIRGGTLLWQAPEVFAKETFLNTRSSDIYSMALVFWRISSSGESLFYTQVQEELNRGFIPIGRGEGRRGGRGNRGGRGQGRGRGRGIIEDLEPVGPPEPSGPSFRDFGVYPASPLELQKLFIKENHDYRPTRPVGCPDWMWEIIQECWVSLLHKEGHHFVSSNASRLSAREVAERLAEIQNRLENSQNSLQEDDVDVGHSNSGWIINDEVMNEDDGATDESKHVCP